MKKKPDNETLLSRACEMVAKYSSTIRELEDVIKKLQDENEKLRDQMAIYKRQLQVTEPGGISAAVNKTGGTNAVSPKKQA